MTKRGSGGPPQGQLFPVPGRPVARVRRGVDAALRAERARLRELHESPDDQLDAALVALTQSAADQLDAITLDRDGSPFVWFQGARTLADLWARLVGHGERQGEGGDPAADAELAALVAALRDAAGP